MREPVGMFTMTWRLIKQLPDLYNLVMQYLGPLLGKGSIISQVLWMIVLIKWIIPGVYWVIDNGPELIAKVLDMFEK